MATVGYVRVSTTNKQTNSIAAQTDALTAVGCERIFIDKMSGARDDRPGLKELLGWVRDGDTVVVAALDRLGRSLSGVIRTIETLQERGIVLRSLREGIDFGSATGRMMAVIFAAMAQYERELIRERASAAREAAIARGMRPGRQPKLTAEQLDVAQKMCAAGKHIQTIMRTFPQASRSTIYKLTTAQDC